MPWRVQCKHARSIHLCSLYTGALQQCNACALLAVSSGHFLFGTLQLVHVRCCCISLSFLYAHLTRPQTFTLCALSPYRLCAPGSVSTGLRLSCTECGVGRAANALQSSCVICPIGKIAPYRAMSSCVDCALGLFADGTDPKQCQVCGPSRSVNGNNLLAFNRSACTACPFGQFAEFNSTDVCSSCLSGTFSNSSTGTQKCQSCPAGTYVDSNTLSSCIPCAPGSISPASSTECEPCRPGTIAQTNLCVPCPPGQFASDSVTCRDCAAGRYANGTGAPSCAPTPAGTFTTLGSSEPVPCSVGSNQVIRLRCVGIPGPSDLFGLLLVRCLQPNPGQAICIPCDPGFFANIRYTLSESAVVYSYRYEIMYALVTPCFAVAKFRVTHVHEASTA